MIFTLHPCPFIRMPAETECRLHLSIALNCAQAEHFSIHSGHLGRQYYSYAQAEQFILHSSHLCKQYYRVTIPSDTRKQTFVKLNQVPELQDVQKDKILNPCNIEKSQYQINISSSNIKYFFLSNTKHFSLSNTQWYSSCHIQHISSCQKGKEKLSCYSLLTCLM